MPKAVESKRKNIGRGRFAFWRVLPAMVPAMLPMASAAAAGVNASAPVTHQRAVLPPRIGAAARALPAAAPKAAVLKIAPAADFGFLTPGTLRMPASAAVLAPAAGTSASASAARPADAAASGIVLDKSLGNAVSGSLTPDGSGIVTIPASCGKQVGGNLFYSFGEFDLAAGQTADFAPGTASAHTILARVTGGPADIDGTLRCTIAGANLFLIDAYGITFGPGATLDLQGSFAVTTASQVQLGPSAVFSASPGSSDAALSAAAPSAFNFLSASPAGVTVNGAQMAVPVGKAASVVAGDISMTGSTLSASGGQVNLISVNSAGDVQLDAASVNVPVTLPAGASGGGDITMAQVAAVRVGGQAGGKILVRGGSLTMGGGSVFGAATGSADGLGIDIAVTGAVSITGGSEIFTETNGTGAAGAINLVANSLSISSGSEIVTSTLGPGDAGPVSVTASSVVMDANGSAGLTGIFTTSLAPAAGNAADITVQATQSIQLYNGALIDSATATSGRGGNIIVTGSDLLFNSGSAASDVLSSRTLAPTGGGPAGSITVQASGSLQLLNGATISAATAGSGPGGNIAVTAGSVLFNSGSVTSTNGLLSGTSAGGAAGNISVQAASFTLRGAVASASTTGSGDAGTVSITAAGNVVVDGTTATAPTGFGAESDLIGAGGNAGTISVHANGLSVLGNGEIEANTYGLSDGGVVSLTANSITLDGRTPSGAVPAQVGAVSFGLGPSGALGAAAQAGNGGTVNIIAGSLQLLPGGTVSATSNGPGSAGTINVYATDVRLQGQSGMLAPAISSNGSSMLPVTPGAAPALGNGGIVNVRAQSVQILDTGEVTANTFATGNGGQVNIATGELLVDQSASITAFTDGASSTGAGGVVKVSAAHSARLLNGGFVGTETSGSGMGGDINFSTPLLLVSGNSLITTGTSGAGAGGSVTIDTRNTVLSNRGVISAGTSGTGATGPITIDTTNLLLSGVSRLDSGTVGPATGPANDITVNASGSVNLDHSLIQTNSTAGGGNVVIHARVRLAMVGESLIDATALGIGGNVSIFSPGTVYIGGPHEGETASIQTNAKNGDGGDIEIDPGPSGVASIVVFDYANIEAIGGTNGGNISIRPGQLINGGSLIDATGIDGESGVTRITPFTNVSGSLVSLPAAQPGTSQLAAQCAAHIGGDISSFIITGSGGIAPVPGDWQPDTAPAIQPRPTGGSKPLGGQDRSRSSGMRFLPPRN